MGSTAPPSLGGSRVATLQALRSDPIGLLERSAAIGDVVALRTPRFPTFLVNHRDLVWDVLATSNHDFMKGPTMQAAKGLLGESLLTSEGAIHQRRRRPITRNVIDQSALQPQNVVELGRTQQVGLQGRIGALENGSILAHHADETSSGSSRASPYSTSDEPWPTS